jgi:hypothetical protein
MGGQTPPSYALLTPDGLRERGCFYVRPGPTGGFDGELEDRGVDRRRMALRARRLAGPVDSLGRLGRHARRAFRLSAGPLPVGFPPGSAPRSGMLSGLHRQAVRYSTPVA